MATPEELAALGYQNIRVSQNPTFNPYGGGMTYDPSANAALGASLFSLMPEGDPNAYQSYIPLSEQGANQIGNLGYLAYDPNLHYRLVDRNTGETVASTTPDQGPEGLADLSQEALAISADDPGASWVVESAYDPEGEWQWAGARDVDVRPDIVSQLAPLVVGTAIGAGTGAGLLAGPLSGAGLAGSIGAGAAGGGLSGFVSSGGDLESALLGAGVGGLTGGLMDAAGIAGAGSSPTGSPTDLLAGTPFADAAATGLTSAATSVLPAAATDAITVVANTALRDQLISQFVASGFSAAAASGMANDVIARAENTGSVDPNTGEIVVSANTVDDLANDAISGLITSTAGNVVTDAVTDTTPGQETVASDEDAITVTAPSVTDLDPGVLGGLTSGLGGQIQDILDSQQVQDAQDQLEEQANGGTGLTGNQTIDDILRYATLAGLGSDVLGSLFGGGSGGGTTTPYTPVLGGVPQFTRGALVPYAGDYETYATRPEHAFFENVTGVLPATTTTPITTPTTTTPTTTTPTTTTPTTTTPTTTTPTTTTPTTTTPTYTPLITGTPTVQAPTPATQDLTPSPISVPQMTNYYSQFGQGLADTARQYGITPAQFTELWQPVAQAGGYNAQGSLQQSQAIATAMQQAEQGLLNLINQQQAA